MIIIGACASAREVMRELIRGEADDNRRLELDAHLAICLECRAEHARWTLMGALRAEPPQLSELARRRVLKAVLAARPAQKPTPGWSFGWLIPAAGAATALAVAAALVLGTGPAETEEGDEVVTPVIAP